MQELATEITEMVITALKTLGRPLTPASLMASTKGEALELAPDAPISASLSDGRMMPTISRLLQSDVSKLAMKTRTE